MTDGHGKRWPRSLYGRGAEPDARFSLANERTFLASVRTGFAFLLAALAIDVFLRPTEPTLGAISSLTFAVLGITVMLHSWIRWFRIELSLRTHKPLPGFGLSTAIVSIAALATFVVALGLVLR